MPEQDPAPLSPPLLQARALRLAFGGQVVFADLDLTLTPGLTLVCGGDGRGKTSLLRMLAGLRPHDGGHIERAPGPVFLADAQVADRLEADSLRAWLQAQHAAHAAWDAALASDLVAAFGLGEHLDKTFPMLSTGTRRKGLLLAAFASGAALTLLDTPFAALDGRSRGVVSELLREAADHPRRAFVLADHGLPPDLLDVVLAGRVDLGD